MDADVVVIGAGAAGLAAARTLSARSLRVVVLEARDRVGGRAWSVPTSRSAIAAELGAEFIHGRARETIALLRAARLSAVDLADETWACARNGELRREERDFIAAADIFKDAASLQNDESVDEFLRRFDGAENVRAKVREARVFVEGFDAADPTIASVRAIAEEWRSGTDLTSARPLGGYGQLFEYLRGACVVNGVQLCLSTAVRRVSWRRGEVAVAGVAADEKPRTIRARAAVVTLPVGVLRHSGDDGIVAFDPDLPASKRDALRSLEMGDVVKVVLCFRTAFWERLCDGRFRDGAFFRCDDRTFPTYWTLLPIRSQLVVAWAGGPKAAALVGIPHDDIVERALRDLSAIFGATAVGRNEFEVGFTHDWRVDPFSRGAYSYVSVGGTSARGALAEPVDGTLFFAGEAASTDGQGGTVNGALQTGERAATEILRSI